MRCLSYCFARSVRLAQAEHVLRRSGYEAERYWQVIKVYHCPTAERFFLFENGTIVSWGSSKPHTLWLIKLVHSCCNGAFSQFFMDGFHCNMGYKTAFRPHNYFRVDCLTLKDDEVDTLLGLSFGFSQSIKLSAYEHRLEQLIKRYYPVISQLAESGEMNLSRKNIKKIIGEILVEKSDLHLVSDFFYQPRFFWQHPNLEADYLMVQQYLDIKVRANNMGEKIDTLNEVFDMFSSSLENKHSHFLEVVIIALIGAEIVLGSLEMLFH